MGCRCRSGGREKSVARRLESISSAGVVELRIHVSVKCNDVGFVVVGEIVECGNMFWGEHGACIEDADEEVCEVGGTWVGLNVPTEKQCSGE